MTELDGKAVPIRMQKIRWLARIILNEAAVARQITEYGMWEAEEGEKAQSKMVR